MFRAWRGCQLYEELNALPAIILTGRKAALKFWLHPLVAGKRQIGAWRVSYHQVPRLTVSSLNGVAMDMKLAAILRWQQITTPRVMPQGAESPPHNSGKFTHHQNFHDCTPIL